MGDGSPPHPRPQLVRDDWVDLCGRWGFCVDTDDRGLAEHWYRDSGVFDREIVVPYPPESKLSEVHDTGPLPVVWYRRTVSLRPPAEGRIILHFGAVDYHAAVWVNGRLVVEHEGGHTPFSADITDALEPGTEQVVVVRAVDGTSDVDKPRGKQDWRHDPHLIWYHRTTGIWQPVWLEHVPEFHLTDVHWAPQLSRAAVTAEVRLSRPPAGEAWLDVSLTCGGELLAQHTVRCLDDVVDVVVPIAAARHEQDLDRLLWSPESPSLVEATLRLHGDAADDEATSYFGYRSVDVDRGRLLLNGRPYFLRLVLEQGYWPESHLAAPDPAALAAEVDLIKELGFNGVRVHQKIEDPRFLYECDRRGLLVWAEMPSSYQYSASSVGRTMREWTEVVMRDRSHPCVVAWVPLNESWGVRWITERADQRSFALALYHLTQALDPSRPVVTNDGWEQPATDIIGLHDYAGSGDLLRQRYQDEAAVSATLRGWGPAPARALLDVDGRADRPVVITEFGGIGFTPRRTPGQYMYSQAHDGDDFLQRLAELVGALHDSTAIAGFCYTQLTDTEQEVNGLLTAERTPKVPASSIRAIVTGDAAALGTTPTIDGSLP